MFTRHFSSNVRWICDDFCLGFLKHKSIYFWRGFFLRLFESFLCVLDLTSYLLQKDIWCVFAKAPNVLRPQSVEAPGASPRLKWAAARCCWSMAVLKSDCSASRRRPSIKPSTAAPSTCATETPPGASWCRFLYQVRQQGVRPWIITSAVPDNEGCHKHPLLFFSVFPQPLKGNQFGTGWRRWLSLCSPQWWFWSCCLWCRFWPAGGSTVAASRDCKSLTLSREMVSSPPMWETAL